jgi:hypothetical protein
MKTYSNKGNAKRAALKALGNEAFTIKEVDGKFAWVVKAPAKSQSEKPVKQKKVKVSRSERIKQNGVRRPAPGGVCEAVWEWCDAFHAGAKRAPVPAEIKVAAEKHGWNQNNASIEMYLWRKFNGIKGRVKAA